MTNDLNIVVGVIRALKLFHHALLTLRKDRIFDAGNHGNKESRGLMSNFVGNQDGSYQRVVILL